MDKYPLIGVSICAVVLLILGSLTNVVGYQSVQSSGVNESPLFFVRTKRAINQESKDTITSNYLGKGNGNLLYFPLRNNKTELLKNIFESIKKMDDATFQRFLILIKQHLRETTSLNDKQLHEIDNGLTVIRKQASLRFLSPSVEPNTTMIMCGFTFDHIDCLFFFLLLIFLVIMNILLFILYDIRILPTA
ncbi:MAG: hypothetical protein IMZ52_02665 [Actinobacteria bacterium]|nr:hypothetical protein [Actinomycetota bacterium]MBE3120639.1 hypothetical protein [Thermoplasmata archaeon]